MVGVRFQILSHKFLHMAKKAPKIPTGRAWLTQMFDPTRIAKDGLVRRSIDDVNKYASFQVLKEMTLEHGFHLIETGDQYVVLCNNGSIIIHL